MRMSSGAILRYRPLSNLEKKPLGVKISEMKVVKQNWKNPLAIYLSLSDDRWCDFYVQLKTLQMTFYNSVDFRVTERWWVRLWLAVWLSESLFPSQEPRWCHQSYSVTYKIGGGVKINGHTSGVLGALGFDTPHIRDTLVRIGRLPSWKWILFAQWLSPS